MLNGMRARAGQGHGNWAAEPWRRLVSHVIADIHAGVVFLSLFQESRTSSIHPSAARSTDGTSCCGSACAGQEVVLTSHIHNRVIPPVSWRCFSASQSSSVQKSTAHSGWKHPETAIRSGLKFGSGFGSGPSSYVNERGSTPIHCSSAVCFRHGVLDADPLVHESWI